MALGNMIPGSGLEPDWRAIGVGAVVLGGLCLLPVLGGWITIPTPTAESPTGAMASPEATEGPGIVETGLPLLIGAPGAFVAGYLARRQNLQGAIEGMLAVPIGATIPVVAGIVDRFLLFQGAGIGWQIEYAWRGAGFYAVAAVPFVPFVCMIGAALGWFGKFTHDAISGGVSVSWA